MGQTVIPPLPDGFKLDASVPPLPSGYTIDQPTAGESPKQEASFTDRLVGNQGSRFLMGMASPVIAGVQALGNVYDKATQADPKLSDLVTGGSSSGFRPGKFINEKLAELEAKKQRGMEATGSGGFDMMGLLGSLGPASAITNTVTKALPAAASIGSRMAVGATAGGATAAAMPVTNANNDYFTQKAQQVGTGAALGGAVPLVTHALMAAKAAAEPFYEKGREQIIGRALRAASGGQEAQVQQSLQNARELVPGSQPTVAQASGNAGLSAMERAASAINPNVKVAYQGREAAQNAARFKELDSVAGTDTAMEAAIKARKAATSGLIDKVDKSTAEVDPGRTANLLDRMIEKSPGRTQLTSTLTNVKKSLYEDSPITLRGKEAWATVHDFIENGPRVGKADTATLNTLRTVMDRVKNGRIDQEEALAQLKGLSGINQKATDLIDAAKAAVKAPDQRLRSNASELYQGARKNIDDLLNAKAGDGSKVNAAIVRELTIAKKSLDHQINKAEPAYGDFLKGYAQGSKPINQMDVGREIADKSVNKLTGVIQPNAYANALSDKTAQRATGFKKATLEGTMTPEQLNKLQSVKDDIARAVVARNAGGTKGSDTIQNLAYSNIIDRAGIPTFIREFAPTQITGNLMARGADSVYGRANKEIAEKLAMGLLSPQDAFRMMQAAGPSKYAPIIDEIMRRSAAPAGVAGGALVNEKR
jgi:hypothetical protein